MNKWMRSVWRLGMCGAVCLGVGSAWSVSGSESSPTADKSAAEAKWFTDFPAAQQEAEKEKVPILMDFTGSDWCGWCIKLDKEVFSQPEFYAYAKDNLVLMKVDFPRKKTLPEAEQLANQALAVKYDVEGYPTIVLVHPDGAVMVTRQNKPLVTGYRPGGAVKYIEHLKSMIASAVK